MKKTAKRILWAVMILILLIGSYFYYSKPIEVICLEIVPKTVTKNIHEKGKVVTADEVTLFSPLSAEINKIHIKENQSVKKGDILISYNTQEMLYQLEQLKAQLESIKGQEAQSYQSPSSAQIAQQNLMIEQAKLQKEASEEEFKKAQSLYEDEAISKTAYEEAKRAAETAANLLLQQEQALQILKDQYKAPQGTAQYFKGQKEVIRAQIDLLEYQMSKAEMTAPMDGIISELNVKEKMITAPGTPLLTMIDPKKLEVEVYLLTEDILDIKENMPVEMYLETNKEDVMIKGIVKEIAPYAQQSISALGLEEERIKVSIEINNSPIPLKPGYALQVNFTTFKEDNCISVPKTALFTYQDQDALWIIKNGRAQIQIVEKGLETEQEIIIKNGLNPGDTIIIDPQTKGLKENKKVYPVITG